jgi:addiction module RelE/StbE family toxin
MPQKYSYVVSRRFVKNWSRLDHRTKRETVEKIDTFLRHPYSATLKTHKLTGKLKDYWAFSISYSLRIMFRFAGEETVEFIDIGGHEIYK